MMLLIENEKSKYTIDESVEGILRGVLDNTVKVLNIDVPLEVSLLLTDNDNIHELNRQYRNMDSPTDVLSFPMYDLDISEDINSTLKEYMGESEDQLLLGDIAISVEKAMEQSIEYGHSFERELGFLMAHGLLHLLGYDHERDSVTADKMRALEEEILGSLGLERTGQ